jgi:MFS family permease
MTKKIITQYLTVLVIHGFGNGLISSIYATYLKSHGLNLAEVNMVNMFFFATLFLAEVPTGAFADVYGRKASYVVSCFLTMLGMVLYALATTFWGFVISEIVIGIGMTFASGSFQAWLVDSLDHHGYQGDKRSVFAHAQIWPKLAVLIAAFVGSYLAEFDMRVPFVLESCVACIEGLIVFFWLEEKYFEKRKFSIMLGLTSVKDTIRHSIQFGIKNAPIRFLLAVGILQTLCMQAPNMQWQPFFLKDTNDVSSLGYIYAGMMLGLFCGSYLAKSMRIHITNERKVLVGCQVVTGVFLVLTVLVPFPGSFIMFILHEVPRGMYGPVKDKFLHDNIPSYARATISSFESMTPHFGAILGLGVSGVLAEKIGIENTWVLAGLFLILCTMCIGYRTRK